MADNRHDGLNTLPIAGSVFRVYSPFQYGRLEIETNLIKK